MVDEFGGSDYILNSFEKEERLIELIKQKEFIYDKQQIGYKDKLRKQNAFTEMEKALGLKAGEGTNIWTRLKKQYTCYLQRTAAGKKSGSGASQSPTTFRHAGSMSFYKTFYRPYKSSTNIADLDESTQDDESVDNVDMGKDTSPRVSNQRTVEVDYLGFGDTVVPEIVFDPVTMPTSIPAIKNDRKKRKQDPDAFEDKLLSAIENSGKATGDEYDHFGAYLAGRVREINGKNKRYSAKLKLEIQQVITKYELKIIDDEEQEEGSEDI